MSLPEKSPHLGRDQNRRMAFSSAGGLFLVGLRGKDQGRPWTAGVEERGVRGRQGKTDLVEPSRGDPPTQILKGNWSDSPIFNSKRKLV